MLFFGDGLRYLLFSAIFGIINKYFGFRLSILRGIIIMRGIVPEKGEKHDESKGKETG